MYRTFLSFLLIILSMPVFANTRTVVTQTPAYNLYHTPQAYYGGDYTPHRKYKKNNSVFSDINDLERYTFNRNFSQDSDHIRLERLETLTFGAIQEGNIYTRYDNVRNAILSKPKQNYKTSLFRNICDYFNGQLTGFTPSLTSNQNDYSYPSTYDNSSSVEYTTPWGKGFRTNNYGFRSDSRVHILD